MTARTIFLIDNLDSFTFNLVDSLHSQGLDVRIFRNTASPDELMKEVRAVDCAAFVLSPGPGGPGDAGCCLDVVRRARGQIGVVGICLGHQVLLVDGGVPVGQTPKPVHGEAAVLNHDGMGPFSGLPNPLRVGRYHSLGGHDVPDGYQAHARIDGVVYAMSSVERRTVGLQFHPESILTPQGDRLLAQAVAFVTSTQAAHTSGKVS